MRRKRDRRYDLFLVGVALLAAFLNIFNIWKDRYANAYYTAAVTSMLQSFHNFFFASFDPGGYVTVDKPPVAFWVQTLFAYFFGVHGWSVVLPQALAGVGSVLLVCYLVKPAFGQTAARFAGLVMACTPIAVAVSRTNNIDSLLVFALLIATWMLFRAARVQNPAWALAAFAMIGVGFNIKMLQAYMVVPAFYFFYLLAFKNEWKKKLALLAAATAIMAVVSLFWAAVVDMIPRENRPYIGGSKTNSVLELALGYNGLERLTGMNRGGAAPGGQRQVQPDQGGRLVEQQLPRDGNSALERQPMPPEGFGPDGNGRPGPAPGPGGGPQGRGAGGAFGTGQPGLLRLFQSELSGQISWLLPFVAFACISLLAGLRPGKPLSDKQQETLFWLAWLLPAMAFFSVAGFFHQYYLIMLAPPIAALAGAGWVELWNQYRDKNGWKRWLLPAALLAATVFQLYILEPYRNQIGAGWSIGIGAAGIGSALVLFLAANKQKPAAKVAVAGMLVLLVAPLYWAATPILYGENSMLPQAGPSRQGIGPGRIAGGGMNPGINTRLITYLTANNTGEKYLFATTDANTAAPYIIETKKPVMAMGGFSGSDPILTVEKLKQMVAKKEVKFFLIPSRSGFGGGPGGNNEVLDWIRANSTEVPGEEWQSGDFQGGMIGMGNARVLYKIND